MLIVPGGKVTMFMAIMMFGEAGADIVYPDPGFPIYRSMIEFAGARPIPMPMREANGFAFSAEEALSLMTPETRLVILNSPANPTGGVTPREEIDKLVAGLARWPNAAILSDEIYGQLTYDGLAHRTLLAYPEIRDRLILLDGWSKTYAMTGWRLGYSVWPKALARHCAEARGQLLFLRQCAGAIRRDRGAQGPAGFGRRDAGRVRPAAQGGDRRPQSAARRPRGDAQGRVLRLSEYFPRPAGRPSRSPRRCCRRRAWRRSAGLISASTARAIFGSPTPIRWKISNARLSAWGLSQPSGARGGELVTRSFRVLFRVMNLIMRPLVLAAAVIALCPAARAEDARPSQAACDAAKIGARELAECLRTNADRSDRQLSAAVEAAIKSIDARQGLMSSQKSRWRRSFNDAQAQWVAWRDSECQDVAPFESGMDAKAGDPRLRCIIDYNAERVSSLKARYP